MGHRQRTPARVGLVRNMMEQQGSPDPQPTTPLPSRKCLWGPFIAWLPGPIPALVTCLELASCQGPALLHLHCLPYLTLLLQLVYKCAARFLFLGSTCKALGGWGCRGSQAGGPCLSRLISHSPDGVAYFSILGFAADGVKERRLPSGDCLCDTFVCARVTRWWGLSVTRWGDPSRATYFFWRQSTKIAAREARKDEKPTDEVCPHHLALGSGSEQPHT